MSNKIKFRVWDVKNEKFIDPEFVAILGNGKVMVTESGYYEHFTNVTESDYIVQQYIGCIDANGKEIYEGDVLDHIIGSNHFTGCVYECGGVFELNYKDQTCDEVAYLQTRNIKIIGNMLENPDWFNSK